jgi:hypothetical protein
MEAGANFPFTYIFQHYISDQIEALISPSDRFIELYGGGYEITFLLSAKKTTRDNQILGPTVYKKTKDVEYSIFLPYRVIKKNPDVLPTALRYLIKGICSVLESLEIDTTKIKKTQEAMIKHICSTPSMLDDEDEDEPIRLPEKRETKGTRSQKKPKTLMTLKLYKRLGHQILYWQAWECERKLYIHQGIIGKECDGEHVVKLGARETAMRAIKRERRQPESKGFHEIPVDEHIMIVIQYGVKGWGSARDLAKRDKVERIVSRLLALTGNGHCDGGDIGSGTINAFFMVIDPEAACQSITDTLAPKRLLSGALIAVQCDEDEFEVLWPEGYEGEFSPF